MKNKRVRMHGSSEVKGIIEGLVISKNYKDQTFQIRQLTLLLCVELLFYLFICNFFFFNERKYGGK